MAPPAMDATPTKGAGSGGSGSNEHTPRTPVVTLPVYQPLPSLSSEAGDDDVSWAGNGTAAAGAAIGNDLDRLPSADSSHQAAAGRAVLLQDEEEEGSGPEEDGSGSRGRLTVSVSALSLSSAAEHQQKHGEGPATPQKAHVLAPSGKTASSDHTTFVAIHSTEDDEGGHGAPVSSPTTAGSSTRSDSDHGLAASGSDALPIPAFPNDDNDEEHHGASEVVEAGGGGIAMGGSIKRARSSSSHHSSGLRTPLGATKPWPDLEDGHGGGGGGGHISSGLALLSPRSLGMECPPSPLRSDVDAGDVRSSVSQMLEDLLHLPRWQYRLMIGSIIFLFSSLVILIILSTLYGFMLNMSHVKVTAVELALPFPHVDKEGNVPVTSTLLLSNSNPFPVRTGTTHVDIFADKNMTQSVGHATVPPMTLHAHEDEHRITFNYSIPHVMNLPGGADLVRHVLNKEASFFYTVSRIPVKVRALGLVPMTRHLKVNCEILRDWAHEGVLLSDCASRFV